MISWMKWITNERKTEEKRSNIGKSIPENEEHNRNDDVCVWQPRRHCSDGDKNEMSAVIVVR